MSLYSHSWLLYKAHSDSFKKDFDYYLNFALGHKTLELFAGYGRLTNYLSRNKVDVEAVEIEPNFAGHIDLSFENIYVCDVLEFAPKTKYQRIIAAYNSFCLLTQEDDIKKFFRDMSQWLEKGGEASLSYFHPDGWPIDQPFTEILTLDNNILSYSATCDLSRRSEKIGVWIDTYEADGQTAEFKYQTRIYENAAELEQFLVGTELEIKSIIYNYDNPEIDYNGWIEYIFVKRE